MADLKLSAEELKKDFAQDLTESRLALRELIFRNREINKVLNEEFKDGEFAKLEEYSVLSEAIIKSVKLLNEVNSQIPKTVKDLNDIKSPKKKINLGDLVD